MAVIGGRDGLPVTDLYWLRRADFESCGPDLPLAVLKHQTSAGDHVRLSDSGDNHVTRLRQRRSQPPRDGPRGICRQSWIVRGERSSEADATFEERQVVRAGVVRGLRRRADVSAHYESREEERSPKRK